MIGRWKQTEGGEGKYARVERESLQQVAALHGDPTIKKGLQRRNKGEVDETDELLWSWNNAADPTRNQARRT